MFVFLLPLPFHSTINLSYPSPCKTSHPLHRKTQSTIILVYRQHHLVGALPACADRGSPFHFSLFFFLSRLLFSPHSIAPPGFTTTTFYSSCACVLLLFLSLFLSHLALPSHLIHHRYKQSSVAILNKQQPTLTWHPHRILISLFSFLPCPL